MAVAGVSWRWVYWVLTFFAGACTVLIVFTLPETFKYVSMSDNAGMSADRLHTDPSS